MKIDYNKYETERYYCWKWLTGQINDVEHLIFDAISLAGNWTVPKNYQQAWF